jgi:transposase-like protein
MDTITKAAHRTNTEPFNAGFSPFAISNTKVEAQTIIFDPFSILPDSCSRPAIELPTRTIPASISNRGNNGNNFPADVGAEAEAVLEKRREGRMSLFNPERAAAVIEGTEDGLTMDDIASAIGVARNTIWTWMRLSPWFATAIAQAREYQGHAIATDAVKILDEVVIDPNNPKAAMAELRKAEQRARIRMELAKAFNFKQYGDKKQNLNVNLNADVSPVDLSRY